MEDQQLLKRYADQADQAAFAQLVEQHGRWILSAARRQLGDEHLAEDVTQATFLLLATRAKRLTGYAYLSGWLFVTLGFCVKHAKRQRARTQRREQEAATMRPEEVQETRWNEVSPLLESAVGRLGKADRDAVLLRFYEQKPLAEVGRAMGVSEDAARKRVDRAVEKLRGMLEKQGVTGTSAGLSAVLAGDLVQELPARVLDGMMRVVGGGGTAAAGGIAKGAMKMMAWTKVKMAVGVLSLIAIPIVLAGEAVRDASSKPVQAVPQTVDRRSQMGGRDGETAPPQAENRLETLWQDMLSEEPLGSRALLAMARNPQETTAFLAARLKPLNLSEERLHELLVQLGSNDRGQWQPAARELEYFDPRLAMNLPDLMELESVQQFPARHRLVSILSGWPVDGEGSFIRTHRFIALRPVGDGYNFVGSEKEGAAGGSWWAEHRVDRLNTGRSSVRKAEWTRIVRALALLESFGTEEATAIIKAMASGDHDAQPTKVANEMLLRAKPAETKSQRK